MQLGSVRMSIYSSKRAYVCLSVRPLICKLFEWIITYCNSTKNSKTNAGQGKNPKLRVSSYYHIYGETVIIGYVR